MKSTRHWVGLICTLGLLWAAPTRADVIVDNPGRFTVDIPSPAKRSDSETDSKVGKTTLHMLTHESADGAQAWIFSYNDYDPAQKLDVAQSYEGIIQNVVASLNGVIRSKVEHKLGDVSGWDYIVDNPKDKFSARVRCYLVDHRLYQIMFLAGSGNESSKEALLFLDSFHLLR